MKEQGGRKRRFAGLPVVERPQKRCARCIGFLPAGGQIDDDVWFQPGRLGARSGEHAALDPVGTAGPAAPQDHPFE